MYLLEGRHGPERTAPLYYLYWLKSPTLGECNGPVLCIKSYSCEIPSSIMTIPHPPEDSLKHHVWFLRTTHPAQTGINVNGCGSKRKNTERPNLAWRWMPVKITYLQNLKQIHSANFRNSTPFQRHKNSPVTGLGGLS